MGNTNESTTNTPMGVCRRILLGAALFATEVGITFELVYMVTMEKLMGLPTQYVSIPGVISASLSLVLTPGLANLGDRGSSKDKRVRKSCLVMLSVLFLVIGSALLLGACLIFIYRSKENPSDNLEGENGPFLHSESSGNHSSVSGHDNDTHGFVQSLGTDIIEVIPIEAIMTMVSFIFIDVGFDTGSTNIRAFILDTSPQQHHERILTTGVLVSALGGCALTALGIVDYGSLFHSVYLGPAFRGIALCCFLILSIFITLPITLIIGCLTKKRTLFLVAQSDSELGDLDLRNETQLSQFHQEASEDTPLINHGNSTLHELKRKLIGFQKLAAQDHVQTLFLICFIMFNTCITMDCFEVFFANFIIEGVFHGDHDAPAGSQGQIDYHSGTRVASQGSLVFMGSFLIYNMVHQKIADIIGLLPEFLLVTGAMVPMMLSVSITKNVPAFYALAAMMGVYRCLLYTTPCVLATDTIARANVSAKLKDISLDVNIDGKDTFESTSETGNGSDNLGSVIGLVFAMIPLSYLTMSSMMGPLLKSTEDSATPMYIGAFVDFIAFAALVGYAIRDKRLKG